MAAKYLAVFSGESVTDSSGMSHRKPVKVGIGLKGLSFKVSHMIPRGVDIQSMSAMQHVNCESSAERGDEAEKSLIGKMQSSSNSSAESSGKDCPLYHFWPPSMMTPPLDVICLAHWAHLLWYSSINSRLIQKNMWSLTHLDRGPRPMAWRMLAPASATLPYVPADGPKPKQEAVSTAKESSPGRQIVRPAH